MVTAVAERPMEISATNLIERKLKLFTKYFHGQLTNFCSVFPDYHSKLCRIVLFEITFVVVLAGMCES